MPGKLGAYLRFLRELPAYLNHPISFDEARQIVARRMESRDRSLLGIFEHSIYGDPNSPYLPLLKAAQCEHGDVAADVARLGVEETLKRLRQAGVWISFEEFKGRKPIVRGDVCHDVRAEDFDSLRQCGACATATGGSSGRPVRTKLDLEHEAARAAYEHFTFRMFGLEDAPFAIWYPQLPAGTGIGNSLRYARMGRPPDRWFDMLVDKRDRPPLTGRLMTAAIVWASRFTATPLTPPRKAPLDGVCQVLDWLVEQRARCGRCALQSYVSQAVRVSHAALRRGIRLDGVHFLCGSEPFTPAKYAEVVESGASMSPRYATAELGTVGLGCGDPAEVGDVHLAHDMTAMIQADAPADADVRAGIRAGDTDDADDGGVFYFTSLDAAGPKVMVNVELGDCGVAVKRRCGCLFGEAGFDTHLLRVRSISRVTCEGMTVPVSQLAAIVDDVLRPRYGGSALDYQWVEVEDAAAFSRVRLRVDARLGPLDEGRIVSDVLGALRRFNPSSRIVAGVWRGAGTLEVVRESPRPTGRGKVLIFVREGPTDRA